MITETQKDYLRQESGTKRLQSLQSTTRRHETERAQLQRDSHLPQRKATEVQRVTKLSQRDNEEIPRPLLILVTHKEGMKGPLCLRPGGPLSPNPNILGSLWKITVVLSCSSTQWDQKCHKLCKNRYEHAIDDGHQRSTCTRAWRAALSALLSRLHRGATPVRVRKWNLSGLALARTRPSYALCQHRDFRRESVT